MERYVFKEKIERERERERERENFKECVIEGEEQI